MSPEDAAKYLQMSDLRNTGFTAEELYNLEKFGSIKTSLDYVPSSGTKITATPGKTTTIVGNYNDDMQYIVDELGNIKSTNLGSKDGGFNILNVPDYEWNRLGADGFWQEYNAPWLQGAIDRGDVVKVATPPTEKYMYRLNDDGIKELTGYGKEIQMLTDAGYYYDPFEVAFIKN